MKTIRDIARIAGVSVATVSKVINNYPDISERTKQKVLEVMKREGYEPNVIAKSLSGKQSYSIGFCFCYNPAPGLHHSFFQNLLYGLEQTLGAHGYDFVILSENSIQGCQDFLYKCRTRQVDGAVFLGVDKNDRRLATLLASNLPAVFIDGDHQGTRSRCVVWDNYSGVRQAVEYLYTLGHRKIAMIKGLPGVKPTEERTEGFLQALRQFDLHCPSQWLVEGGDYLETCGYEGMLSLLSLEDKPTAVFCQSDTLAIGALRAVEDSGFGCPEDFSIIGYDDIDVASYIKPKLTTVRQDTVLMGKTAAEVLLSLIRDPKSPTSPVVLPVELVRCDSCHSVD